MFGGIVPEHIRPEHVWPEGARATLARADLARSRPIFAQVMIGRDRLKCARACLTRQWSEIYLSAWSKTQGLERAAHPWM